MEKSYVLTLSVAIDLPEGAKIVGGVIRYPDGKFAIPQMSFLVGNRNTPHRMAMVSDFEDINDRVGLMEYMQEASLREMTDGETIE